MEKLLHTPLDVIAGRLKKQPLCLFCSKNGLEDPFSARLLSLSEQFKIRHCRRCGLRWLDPRPTQEAYDDLYRYNYYEAIEAFDEDNYLLAMEERKNLFHDRLRRIRKLIPQVETILDIGAGSGDFVAVARELGFACEGIEPSVLARKGAQNKYGLNLVASFEDISASFTMIHLNHVLEHVLDPILFIQKIKNCLSKAGILVIEVPYQFENFVELRHRLLGHDNSRPFSVYSIHHPYFYSPRSLGWLLQETEFKMISLSTWNKHIIRGSFREKWLLGMGNLFFKRGDFIEVIAQRDERKG